MVELGGKAWKKSKRKELNWRKSFFSYRAGSIGTEELICSGSGDDDLELDVRDRFRRRVWGSISRNVSSGSF